MITVAATIFVMTLQLTDWPTVWNEEVCGVKWQVIPRQSSLSKILESHRLACLPAVVAGGGGFNPSTPEMVSARSNRLTSGSTVGGGGYVDWITRIVKP